MRKWTVRALVAAGATLGLASCCSNKPNPAIGVYGPGATINDIIQSQQATQVQPIVIPSTVKPEKTNEKSKE